LLDICQGQDERDFEVCWGSQKSKFWHFSTCKSRECEYRESYGSTLNVSGRRHLWAVYICYVKRYHVRSLGINGNVEYKIIKFSAYCESAKLTFDQSG